MKRLRRIVGLVLLLLWVPITTHCTLENVPGLQFLKCSTEAEQETDCEADVCAQLETASYKITDHHADFLPPAFAALYQLVAGESSAEEPPPGVIAPPPEISSSWCFFYRTALPPRAPSFDS